MRTTWRVLAGHRDLRLVLSAGVISQTGDWILTVGLLYRVYAMTGSTVATALAMLSSLNSVHIWYRGGGTFSADTVAGTYCSIVLEGIVRQP